MPVVRPAIKTAFVLTCLAALTVAYFRHTPLPFFTLRLKEILLAALIVWSAGGWGTWILSLCRLSLTKYERFLFAEGLGFGALSSVMILLGVFNAWVPLGGWALVITGVLLSQPFYNKLKTFRSLDLETGFLPAEFYGPASALAIGAVLSFILALAPITYYDSLVYHFAMPAAYLQAHHWVPLQGLIYSAFPQNLEMLWTLALLVGDDTVANLVGWTLSMLLLAGIVTFARRFMTLSVGLIAAALIALMPAFLLLSSGGYVDVGLTLFCFLALYAACLADDEHAGPWVCAGLFAGWAVGTKYTGGISVVLTAAVLALRLGKGTRIKSVMVYGACALAVFSPWLVKNTLYVGNPVFPFLYSWGIKALNPWVNQAAAGYFAGVTEYYSRSLWDLPKVLWDAAVNPIRFGRGMDVLGDFGWLPLLSFLPVLWICRKLSGTARLLLGFSALYFVIWASCRPVLRFLLPVSPLLALLTAYAWVYGIRSQRPVLRTACRIVLGSFLLSGLFLFFYTTSLLSVFGAALGLEDRDAYLSRQLNYYSAAHFINTQTPPDSRIYVMGDQRGYYYQRQTWISPVFSRNPLVEWANAAPTPQALRDKLKVEGVTHVLFNRDEFKRLQVYRFSTFNEHGQQIWDRLQAASTPLYRDRACDVYGL